MATEQKTEGAQPINAAESQQIDSGNPAIGFAGKIEAKFRQLKENAIAYPHVWASVAVVYGSFGLWFFYRLRTLRKVEDSVRILQAELCELVMAEAKESSATASSSTAAATASKNTSSSAASKNASSSAASRDASSSAASEKASSSTTNVSKQPK